MKRFDSTNTVYTPIGDKAILPAPVAPAVSDRDSVETIAFLIWAKATLFIGIMVLALTALIFLWVKWPVILSPIITLIVMIGCFAPMFWCKGVANMEKALGIDLPGGNKQPPELKRFKLTIEHKGNGRTSFINVVTTENIVRNFCEEVLKDRAAMTSNPPYHTTAEAWMEAHGVPRSKVRELRDQMISLDYARWDGPKNGGWSLTDDGIQWVSDWLRQLPSPT